MNNLRAILLAGLVGIAASGATAATITISVLDATSYNAGFGGGANVGEDFESFAAGGEREVGFLGTPFDTGTVGTFETLGGTGSGGTVTNSSFANSGLGLAIRTGSVYGRDNTTPTGGNWFLDSNDTYGMVWNVGLSGGTGFTQLAFTISDGSDTGAYLRVSSEGAGSEFRLGGKLPNYNERLVLIDFGGVVTSAVVMLENFYSDGTTQRINDGFSIDGVQVSAVPLPASLALLGASLLGLGTVARRRRRET